MKKWVVFGLSALAVALSATLVGCAGAKLPSVSLDPAGPAASPALQVPPGQGARWRAEQGPNILKAFAENVYGAAPPLVDPIVTKETLQADAFDGAGALEQWHVSMGEAADAPRFNMVVAVPKSPGPHPVIIMQNFCGNRAALPDVEGIAPALTTLYKGCEGGGFGKALVQLVFGRYISAPPFQDILKRGYAAAIYYAGDVAADNKAEAPAALAKLTTDANAPPGAIAIWAWTYSEAARAFAADQRFAADRIAIWGHSRNGKAALLAGAQDPTIAAVIALQPGTGGAALTREKVGETVAQMTKTYPFWFTPNYASFAGREDALPVDQHQLLALIAPRALLVTAARRDQWSDPQGSWRALEGAAPAWEGFGSRGLGQSRFPKADSTAPATFFLRGGLHGVHSSDWRFTLDWLEAQFGAVDATETAPAT